MKGKGEEPEKVPGRMNIGRYEVIDEIGRGGMGVVYLCRDPVLDRFVAVKTLLPRSLSRKSALKRFLREARVSARLDHPNIVRLHDIGEEGGIHYIVMEYVPGKTLREIIEGRSRAKIPEMVGIFRQICRALDYAHSLEVVHRDLKPENVIVSDAGSAKVLDFGLACLGGNHTLTSAGTVMGTLAYLSPEQARGEEVDHRSDIYSAGIMLFEMLTGRHPFASQSAAEMFQKNLTEPPPAMRKIDRRIPENMEVLVFRALRKDPGERFQSAVEMLEELDGLKENLAETSLSPPLRVSVGKVEVFTNSKDGSELIMIPAGEFLMGSNDYDNEKPSHRVYLNAYYIGKYEVTNEQFARFVNETGYNAGGSWKEYYNSGTADHPVVCVSWNDAVAYCDWANLRLPTEAEWEKAARGTDGRKYPWGNEWDVERCNWSEGPELSGMANIYSGRGTLPVGSFSSGESPYGCLDMAGNVWEWCSDWYGENYYSQSPSSNPVGPGSGEYRILRGGSWSADNPDYLRCANRGGGYPDLRLSYGFRVCRSVNTR